MSIKFYKETVGERQMCRRVAKELKDSMVILKNEALINNPLNQSSSSHSNDRELSCDNSMNIPTVFTTISSDNFISINSGLNDANIHIVESDSEIVLGLSDSNSSSDDKSTEKVNLTFEVNSELKKWAIRNKVTHSTVTDLLHTLSPFHPELPLSSKTLLNTPTAITLKRQLSSGTYVHFGFQNYLKMYLSKTELVISSDIQMSFNVDGLPLFKSSAVQFWPILGLIVNSSVKLKPFAIGVFCGKSKPSPLDDYLNDFIVDLKLLLEEGFTFKNQKYKIKVHSFICDAPARAFIKCTKTHNGYSGCDKCIEEGDYFKNRIIFNNNMAQRRSDQSFLLKLDQNHHTGISPLENLNIGMISKFPIDPMHCLYLGVMKKLLLTWTGGDLRVRLSGKVITKISQSLIFYREFVVSEFNRKPRSLSDIARFKATEFRTFLIYIGVLVLKDIDKAMYEHFLLLHSSITILSSKRHLANFDCDVAKQLLDCFITHCKPLYGLEFLTYNVHVLCHLSEEAQLFSCLDEFSAFPFENYLNELKKYIKSPNKPLEQLFYRLMEANNVSVINNNVTKKCEMQHFCGPLLNTTCNSIKQYKKIKFNNFEYTTAAYSTVNCYCLNNQHQVIKISNIIVDAENNISFIGQKFTSYESFYNYPFQSKSVDICIVSKLQECMESFPFCSVVTKCMLFPLDSPQYSKLLSLPLLS